MKWYGYRKKDSLFLAWTQASWAWQQESNPSQGFCPGHPLYRSPQYFPYLKKGGTAITRRPIEGRHHFTIQTVHQVDPHLSIRTHPIKGFRILGCFFFFFLTFWKPNNQWIGFSIWGGFQAAANQRWVRSDERLGSRTCAWFHNKIKVTNEINKK